MLQLFCLRSYSYLPIVALLSDDTLSARGGISYLMADVCSFVQCFKKQIISINFNVFKEADFYLSSSLATISRIPKVDFPAAWSYWPASALLPYPKETFNLTASFEPLSYEVWTIYFSSMRILRRIKRFRPNLLEQI